MAYAYDPNLDPNLKDDEDQKSPTIASGGDIAGASGTSFGAAAPQAGSKIQDRFQNIDSYLNANSDKQLGSEVAGKVQADVDKAAQSQTDATKAFQQRSDAGTVQYDKGVVDKAVQDPSAFLSDPSMNQFASMRDAKYSGPSSLSDTQDLQSQVQGSAQSATDKAKATQTEGGRFALLDNYFGRPSYSQGQKSLDQALVQTDKSAQPAFQKVQEGAKGVQSNLAQMQKNLSDYAAGNRGTTEATRANTRSAIGIDDSGNATGSGAYGQTMDALNKQTTDYQSALDKARAIASTGDYGSLDATTQNAFSGLNGYYGVDPSKYFSLNGGPVTNATVASPEQLAKIRALSQLAGLSDDQFGGTDAGSMYGKDPYAFNSQDFVSAVNSSKDTFMRQKDGLQAQIDGLTSKGVSPQDPRVKNLYDQMSQLYGSYGMTYIPTSAIRLDGLTPANDPKLRRM